EVFQFSSNLDTTTYHRNTGAMNEETDDIFYLYDLQVETIRGEKDFVCSHEEGVNFRVEGENIIFPGQTQFSLYALAAILPLLPAKQRETAQTDWMTTDTDIACPDPNCGARFRITRIAKREFRHSACTVVPLTKKDNN
ncbi:MAG: TIGR04076 family protein, partial [Spirochaetota bacterium]